MDSALMANYGHPQLEFDHGKGCYLYTAEGDAYLDFTMGIAVNCLGHCHPSLVAALHAQAEKLWHSSNLFRIPQTEKLARRLVELSFADQVFFSNSGTEAIEAGFKMMRRYHYSRGDQQRKRIITVTHSFHGRTLAPVAACRNPVHSEGFLYGDSGFDQAEYGDIMALRALVTHETAGIVIEPIQGEGGIRVASTDYLQQIRTLCDEQGILLMFDEVQSGMGRSGALYAYQLLGVEPDLLASAKGLGGGFPIGACLATNAVAKPMIAGSHGSTFGGNPLATAVGNAVLDEICREGFLQQVRHKGELLAKGLEELMLAFPDILQAQTGMGLMRGLKCKVSNTQLIEALLEEKMLVVKAGGNSIRLLPPLNVEEKEISSALVILYRACKKIASSGT